MARLFITKAMKTWLTTHWPTMDLESLTVGFNAEFGVDKTPAQIKATLANYKINNGRKKGALLKGINREYTPEMITYLSEHYPKAPVAQWMDDFNQRFSTDKSKKTITGACKRFGIKSGRTGQFEKGLVPHNKGKSFPLKGKAKETAFGGIRSNRPDDEKPLGSTRIDSKDGYLLIKVRMGTNAYELYHRVLWAQHYGEIPPNHVIRFYDNSPEKLANPTIENLFMVSRQVHARLTQMKLTDIPMEHKATMILIAKIEQQIKDRSAA